MAKKDNNANIACLRGRKFLAGKDINLVRIFLSTDFSHGERHKRRLAKIARYEK
jgi:ribose 5-phosphate isomerase B